MMADCEGYRLGLQPSVNFLDAFLGLRPRLVYVAPLALGFGRGSLWCTGDRVPGDRGALNGELCSDLVERQLRLAKGDLPMSGVFARAFSPQVSPPACLPGAVPQARITRTFGPQRQLYAGTEVSAYLAMRF